MTDYFSKNLRYLEESQKTMRLHVENGETRKITIDGPMSKAYNSSPLKILWILKEPNGGGGWSLIDYVQGLYNPEILDGEVYLKGGLTYICLAAATYGIIHDCARYGVWAENRKEIYSILSQVSIINLNKFGGGTEQSKHYYPGILECKELVGYQLNTLSPETIICGGTFADLAYIGKAPAGLNLKWPVRGSNGRFDAGRSSEKQLYISAYHTGVRSITISRSEYVNRILKAVRRYR